MYKALVKRLRNPDWFDDDGLGDASADVIEQLQVQVAKYQNAFDRMEDAFAVMKEMTRKPPREKDDG